MIKKITLINYIGGKQYLINNINKYLDKNKNCFIDLFGGSGKVVLNLDYDYKVKIYNDLDEELTNLFIQIKDNYDNFIKAIDLPYSEIIFKRFREKRKKNDYKNDLEKAVITYYLYNCSFSSDCSAFSYSFLRNNAKIFSNKTDKLNIVKQRIKEITILDRDYKLILDSIADRDDIMLYADPPYFGTEDYYKIKFTKEDHHILSEYLNKAKYSVMLSYYYFDGIEDLYPKSKWRYIKIPSAKHSYGITKNSKHSFRLKSVELLICNYEFKKEIFGSSDN